MLDQSLIEILRLRASDTAFKRAAAKWTVARNIAKWTYDRIPEGAHYRMFSYADSIRAIPDAPVAPGPLRWLQKLTASSALDASLNASVPDGATNLKQVFETASRLQPAPTQILIITDGLPTLPGDTPLQKLRRCKRPPRNGVPLIDAECRASIFGDAMAVAATRLPSVRIDVVLLPLEGDSDAAGHYWELAQATDGRMLTPASEWPLP